MIGATWALRAAREVYHPWYARPDRFFLLLLAIGTTAAWTMSRAGGLLPARARGLEEPLRTLVVHRDSTERDYVAAALLGWGHTVVSAESASEARTRLEAGGIDVALIDDALIAAEPAACDDASLPVTCEVPPPNVD